MAAKPSTWALAIGGLPAFVLAIVLLTVGTTFLGNGIIAFAKGLASMTGVLPPGVKMHDTPIETLVSGFVMLVLGAAILAILGACVWFAAKTVRRLLPRRV